MAKKRPCRICRKWFTPHPRAGARQQVCSAEVCQRERHRRSCTKWHEKNPDYDRAERLRRKVVPVPKAPPPSPLADPMSQVAWEAARDAVGFEVMVIVEESQKVLVDWARDAVVAQQHEITRQSRKVGGFAARDALGDRAPPT
jgi:hypothetical protein